MRIGERGSRGLQIVEGKKRRDERYVVALEDKEEVPGLLTENCIVLLPASTINIRFT